MGLYVDPPERATHDCVRAGTTTLFAALEVATGKVIGSLHRRHRAEGFKKFLIKLDKEVPADLDIHLICGNYAAHKTSAIKKWLSAHPPVPSALHTDRLVLAEPRRALPFSPAGAARTTGSRTRQRSELSCT